MIFTENRNLYETDFSVYGVSSPDIPADDALAEMLADDRIQVIHAYTPLHFKRRHRITRSGITLDFHGNTVTAQGIEPAPENDPFCAVLYFTGKQHSSRTPFPLPHSLTEMSDILPVPDAAEFPVYSWWRVQVNNLLGREERELDKLLMVTEKVDDTHVRVNYKLGWPLAAGRILTYTEIQPVQDVTVKNMRFDGNPPAGFLEKPIATTSLPGAEKIGAHPLAFEFAVNCNAENIHVRHSFWPGIMRRHNTEYYTKGCSLINPVEVVIGGTGYLTQQIHCLYGNVENCTASNARHLNDFTGSAYCSVRNCHADGDFHGGFVTHGQFEHDLYYAGNSGLLSFANSGPTWGSAAKRITVERHAGCWCLAYAKVSDLTLRDVSIYKTEKYPDCGTFLLNADGLQMSGCQGEALVLSQGSHRSLRPVVIRDSVFTKGMTLPETLRETVRLKDTILGGIENG